MTAEQIAALLKHHRFGLTAESFSYLVLAFAHELHDRGAEDRDTFLARLGFRYEAGRLLAGVKMSAEEADRLRPKTADPEFDL